MAEAGIDKSDPIEPVLVAFSQNIVFLEQRMQLNEERLANTAREALAFVKEAKQTADAEERRLAMLCRKTEGELLTSFSKSVEIKVEAFLERRRIKEETNVSLLTTIAILFVFVVTAQVCYNFGKRSAAVDIQETEAGLQEAFRQGPENARQWMQLMRNNDIAAALNQCVGEFPPRAPFDGKNACKVPLWLTKAPGTDVPPQE